MTTPVHQALIPLDAPPRPLCGATGRSVMHPEDVTCPDCRERLVSRTAETVELPDGRTVDAAAWERGETILRPGPLAATLRHGPAEQPSPGDPVRPITAAEIQPGDVVTDRDGDRWTAGVRTWLTPAGLASAAYIGNFATEVEQLAGPLRLVERAEILAEPSPAEEVERAAAERLVSEIRFARRRIHPEGQMPDRGRNLRTDEAEVICAALDRALGLALDLALGGTPGEPEPVESRTEYGVRWTGRRYGHSYTETEVAVSRDAAVRTLEYLLTQGVTDARIVTRVIPPWTEDGAK